ncbi:MAG: DUF3626 domain-containing protein [Desulfovibrio sp.]|nr:DUF3626 domain-containing protein [Desulfovibrio sp.]
MSQEIQQDYIQSQRQLAERGITESTGVFGNHRVQFSGGAPIRLDKIKSASIPFAGFRTVTKIARGREGIQKCAGDVLQTLATRSGTLDAAKLLGHLKALQRQTDRLDKLGQIVEAQRADKSWTFSSAVQSLSNSELSAVYQSFTTAEMDLLQTALLHEGRSYKAKAVDARKAAAQLFDLQALVLKEISNRSLNEQIAQTGADLDFEGLPNALNPEQEAVLGPKPLTKQFPSVGTVPQHVEEHDITAANLVSLTETAALSATRRDNTAVTEQAKLQARGLDNVTVKEIGDALRKSELTINIKTEFLVGGDNSIFQHPNEPMVNIFHLHNQGVDPRSAGYLDERNSTEEVLFPEFKGHEVNADERPMYGALNIRGRTGGLGANAGYGSSVIVLKPEVAKRSTYIVNDTFFAARINVSQERRQNFYRLLDGANDHLERQRFGEDIPAQLITALKDPNSAERKDFEAFLDNIAAAPGPHSVIAFKLSMLPASMRNHFKGMDAAETEAVYSTFKGFLTECFGDSEATRSVMATHDSLENLLPQMNSVDGNNLARAALESRNGGQPKACLHGAGYIEAQIQGPLVPSRDIAEIRINVDDVPADERDALIAQARQYANDTGIKITFLQPEVEEADAMNDIDVTGIQDTFNLQHRDTAALEQGKEEYLRHLGDKVREHIAYFPTLEEGLPKGALRLEGNALNKLGSKFLQEVNKRLASSPNDTVEEILDQAFSTAADSMLRQKAELLRDLEKAGLNDAQKAAVTQWVVSAKALRSPAEMQVILKYAKVQGELFRGILSADQPLAPEDVFQRIAGFSQDMEKDLNELIRSFNDPDIGSDEKMVEQERIAFMSLALLQHGDPPVGKAELEKLNASLAGPSMRTLLGQLAAIKEDAQVQEDAQMQESPDFARFNVIDMQLQRNALNLGRLLGQDFRDPPTFPGELSLLPEPLRAALRQVTPQLAQKLDEEHPPYPPFPAAADAQRMPQNEAERRNFLVTIMDPYIEHEKTFEMGTSVHGRGHIARAYIFANVMCNILEEQGIKVDKNAVLCGIAGHDLGRQGGGQDYWEERSANMTTEAMRMYLGENVMGQDYEQQVKDSIDRHKGQTLEAMLLNAADSLDIGRVGTGAFKINFFPFLRGKKGEVPSAWAENIRTQLALEADTLQRLTNPLCARRQAIDALERARDNSTNDIEMVLYHQKREDLRGVIAAEFQADWEVPSDAYMQRFEDIIRKNPQMFPLLSKYYH